MLFSLAILLAHAVAPVDTGYKDYCNSRFDFCIEYPAGFKGEGEAGNGDGQSFQSKDHHAKITAFGRLMMEDLDADSVTNKVSVLNEFKSDVEDVKVVYKSVHDKWFIFSGTDKKGNTVYQKTVLKLVQYMGDEKPDTWVIQTVSIHYPPSEQATYGPYCAKIAKFLTVPAK